MLAPNTRRTEKVFHWFFALWLLTAVGCALVAVGLGYDSTRAVSWVLSLAVWPIVTGYSVMVVLKWMHRSHN